MITGLIIGFVAGFVVATLFWRRNKSKEAVVDKIL